MRPLNYERDKKEVTQLYILHSKEKIETQNLL